MLFTSLCKRLSAPYITLLNILFNTVVQNFPRLTASPDNSDLGAGLEMVLDTWGAGGGGMLVSDEELRKN